MSGPNGPIQGLDYNESERLDFIKERSLHWLTDLHVTKVDDVDMKSYAAWLNSNYEKTFR